MPVAGRVWCAARRGHDVSCAAAAGGVVASAWVAGLAYDTFTDDVAGGVDVWVGADVAGACRK